MRTGFPMQQNLRRTTSCFLTPLLRTHRIISPSCLSSPALPSIHSGRLSGHVSSSLEWSSLHCSARFASYIKIANRKRVEMFMGRRFHVPTRLATAAPDIAAEWDTEKNPGHLYPAIVGVGYMDDVWWRCSICNTSYTMSVEKRVVRGGGCPECKKNDDLTRGEETRCGEFDPALRSKRPPMLTLRTKY